MIFVVRRCFVGGCFAAPWVDVQKERAWKIPLHARSFL